MSLGMYGASVPVFNQMLRSLSGVLDKAGGFCAGRRVDPKVLLSDRLYPDMFPLARQVQIATDHAKGAPARLAGIEVPVFQDTEATLDELKARIGKTLDFLKTVPREKVDGSEDKDIPLTVAGQPMTFKGKIHLLGFAMPNFFFHTTTAYNILRHNGVEIGKRDFLNPPAA